VISAVLDSNVLLSGIVGARRPRRAPGELMRMWRAGVFDLVCSEPIVDEVARALRKPYFRRRLTEDQAGRAVALLRRRSLMTGITIEVAGVATHPEDDRILATAVSAGADYLVTGDSQLLRLRRFRTVRVVSPPAFVEQLRLEDDA